MVFGVSSSVEAKSSERLTSERLTLTVLGKPGLAGLVVHAGVVGLTFDVAAGEALILAGGCTFDVDAVGVKVDAAVVVLL